MDPRNEAPESKVTPMHWFVLSLGAAIAMAGVAMDNEKTVGIGLCTCLIAAGLGSLRSWLRSWFDR